MDTDEGTHPVGWGTARPRKDDDESDEEAELSPILKAEVEKNKINSIKGVTKFKGKNENFQLWWKQVKPLYKQSGLPKKEWIPIVVLQP